MATVEFNGTGGIMEGDFGTNDIEVNLDPVYGNLDGSGNLSSAGDDFDDILKAILLSCQYRV